MNPSVIFRYSFIWIFKSITFSHCHLSAFQLHRFSFSFGFLSYSHQVLIYLSFLFSLFYKVSRALPSAPRLPSPFICLISACWPPRTSFPFWQLSISTLRVCIFFVLVFFNSIHPFPAKIYCSSLSLFSL